MVPVTPMATAQTAGFATTPTTTDLGTMVETEANAGETIENVASRGRTVVATGGGAKGGIGLVPGRATAHTTTDAHALHRRSVEGVPNAPQDPLRGGRAHPCLLKSSLSAARSLRRSASRTTSPPACLRRKRTRLLARRQFYATMNHPKDASPLRSSNGACTSSRAQRS